MAKWHRYTCYVYGPDGLFGAYGASGAGLTKRGARARCLVSFAEEPIGRDVKPKKPRVVVVKE